MERAVSWGGGLTQAELVARAVEQFGPKKNPCAESIVSDYVDTLYAKGTPEWWMKWHQLCDLVAALAGGERKRKEGGGRPRKEDDGDESAG